MINIDACQLDNCDVNKRQNKSTGIKERAMNVCIICFSQTGNTRKIAEQIQRGIIGAHHDCHIVSLKDTDPQNLGRYDLVGIGAPTFYYREPRNVSDFIERMNKSENRHCFIFCTHGSIIGNTFCYMQEALIRKGYQVIDAFDVYADSSLQFYPKVMHTKGHPDLAELSEAEKFEKNICDKSLGITKGTVKPIPLFEKVENTWWVKDSEMLMPEVLRELFPKFVIDENRCTRCGVCVENCPVDAIDLDAQPPEIQKQGCIFCLYCEKSCPEGAIVADWDFVAQAIRGNLKKYVAELKDFEQQGKFIPHVDYEKIV
jgi:flavodoxin/NAD-dependent dihydropyrimidine dehydrogenase PreA subunit